MLKIVIADDEFPSRQELRALLETNSNLEIIAECEHGEAVLDPKEEIYLIKTDTSKKILIYTNKGILESNLPLKTLEEKLRPCGFLRTHKSYIVNMNKVREIIPWFNDTYILTVENCLEKEIPVSRHFIQSFKTFLNL